MTDDLSFEKAIVENPGDLSLRLVYADWLEERGDVRADFIRIMEEMKDLPIYSDRFWQLRPRRNELRSMIDADWIDRLGYTPLYRPMFTSIPERRVERWRLVEEFIELWHRPLQAGDGYSEDELSEVERELGFRFPTGLREWYQLAGKRNDIWCKQDALLSPQQILRLRQSTEPYYERFQNDRVVFFAENQSCEIWGFRSQDLSDEDPAVIGFEEAGPVSPSISVFAVQVLFYETRWRAPVMASVGFPDNDTIQMVQHALTRCSLPERYWVADPTYVYEGENLFVIIDSSPYIYVAARTKEAVSQLGENIQRQLEWYE